MPKWSDHDIDNTGDCLPDCWCKNPSPSSSDLVERLKHIVAQWEGGARWELDSSDKRTCAEAADTIQRLEADNQAWKEAWEREHAHCNAYNEEITALQSERDEWRLALENIRDGHTFGIKPSEIARAALTHAPIAAGGGENVSVRSPGWEPVKPGEWPLENVKPSSSDLVERLRREAESKSALRHNDWDLLVEAADTIECLSARIKELEAKHG
jgi:hypothetical protein